MIISTFNMLILPLCVCFSVFICLVGGQQAFVPPGSNPLNSQFPGQISGQGQNQFPANQFPVQQSQNQFPSQQRPSQPQVPNQFPVQPNQNQLPGQFPNQQRPSQPQVPNQFPVQPNQNQFPGQFPNQQRPVQPQGPGQFSGGQSPSFALPGTQQGSGSFNPSYPSLPNPQLTQVAFSMTLGIRNPNTNPRGFITYRKETVKLNAVTNLQNGVFTVSIPGIYLFSISAKAPSSSPFRISLRLNNDVIASIYAAQNRMTSQITLATVSSGQYVYPWLEGDIADSEFMGYLISPFGPTNSFGGRNSLGVQFNSNLTTLDSQPFTY